MRYCYFRSCVPFDANVQVRALTPSPAWSDLVGMHGLITSAFLPGLFCSVLLLPLWYLLNSALPWSRLVLCAAGTFSTLLFTGLGWCSVLLVPSQLCSSLVSVGALCCMPKSFRILDAKQKMQLSIQCTSTTVNSDLIHMHTAIKF